MASWNAGAQRIKGYTAEEIVGDALRKWARDLYHRIGDSKPGTPRQKWDAVWADDMRPRIGDAVDLRVDAVGSG